MARTDVTPKGKELTGRKVLAITVGFFAVIISVNLYMAFMAVGTFPGLEVKNSYVASQQFDRNRTAQLALGWEVTARIESDELLLSIVDADGVSVVPSQIDATLGRATHLRDDQVLAFTRGQDGVYRADVGVLAGGNWNLRLKAHAADGTMFQQRIVIYIAGR
ncbi:MAG: FixH family protein [Rhodobacteraceae bacterium]|nr:FixH family protein [Paracoccaceae bacterium]